MNITGSMKLNFLIGSGFGIPLQKYLSPVFTFDTQSNRIQQLYSAGLMNQPNLQLTVLNQHIKPNGEVSVLHWVWTQQRLKRRQYRPLINLKRIKTKRLIVPVIPL